jgi:hypothetical protein
MKYLLRRHQRGKGCLSKLFKVQLQDLKMSITATGRSVPDRQ